MSIRFIDFGSLLMNFQTFIFRQDDGSLIVGSQEGLIKFQELQEEWEQQFDASIWNDARVESDLAQIPIGKRDLFLQAYPTLKEQLRINETYGIDIWVEFPEGLQKEQIDLIHTPDEIQ